MNKTLEKDGIYLNLAEATRLYEYYCLDYENVIKETDWDEKHYINRTGTVYIPEILNAYKTPYVSNVKSKNQLINEIMHFMSYNNLNFNPSKPNNITPENIQSIMGVKPVTNHQKNNQHSGKSLFDRMFGKNKYDR